MNKWEEECIKVYGKVLNGEFKHFCPEWDFLPIDETCGEFECCTCYQKLIEEENKKIND